MKAWWTLLRIPNVLIAVFTTILFYQVFVKGLAAKFELQPSLTFLDFTLFIAALSLIMMGAYIINDIEDVETDSVNRPQRPIPAAKIQISTAYKVYITMLIIGTLISIFVSYHLNRHYLGILFPIIYLALYFYAAYLKNSIFWGNVLIALLCGLVPFVLVLGEWPLFIQIREVSPFLHSVYLSMIIFTSIFIFIVTLTRELVKVVEDLPGDHAAGLKTIATKLGIDNTRLLIQLGIMSTLGFLVFWTYFIFPFLTILNICLTLIPIVLLIVYIYRLSDGELTTMRMNKASILLKILMILGTAHILITAISI